MITPVRPRWLLLTICLGACQAPLPLLHVPAPNPLGPYSGAVDAGDLLFVSGKIGTRGGSFEQEALTAIQAVQAQLVLSGLTLADVVSVTVYLTDLDSYGEFNRIYAAHFTEPFPARAVVEVARLPGDARVEIQAIAAKGFTTEPLRTQRRAENNPG
ncbi:MAG: Rid family hydrolase [Planctomycetota bacterium]|jgi:2-iminobutanoate/2-iminopropanoate deaminase